MPELEKHYTEWNNHFCAVYKGVFFSTLDAYNFGLTRAKNVGPKTMEYLSF